MRIGVQWSGYLGLLRRSDSDGPPKTSPWQEYEIGWKPRGQVFLFSELFAGQGRVRSIEQPQQIFATGSLGVRSFFFPNYSRAWASIIHKQPQQIGRAVAESDSQFGTSALMRR